MKFRRTPWTMIVLATLSGMNISMAFGAQPSATPQSPLLLIGPVESVDAKTNTAVVVGQKVFLGSQKRPIVGTSIEVFGKIGADSVIRATAIQSLGTYVAGSSAVLVTGLVKSIDTKLARVTIGSTVIDYSPALSSSPPPDAKVGALGQFVGSQPVDHGTVLANQFQVTNSVDVVGGNVSLDGIIGGGLAASGIIGGGVRADGIIGGGLALDGIIGGGKLAVDGIIGGGL